MASRRNALWSIKNTGRGWAVASSVVWLVGIAACLAPPRPREATVFFASGADLQSINPLIAVHPLAKQVQKHVLFLTLAAYDSAIRPAPRLATWEWNPERTVLTFSMRSDVRWHDGVPTTADDVVWTLDQARDPTVAYPRARDLSSVTAVRRIDSLTVALQFDRPQPVFPDVLTDLAVLPRHRFAGATGADIRTAPFNAQPVGNGPFEFVEYRPNQRWVFRRAEGFPEALGRPRIERFVVVVVDEATTKLAALTSGELDFAGINPAHASFVREDPRLTIIDYPVQFANAVLWNLRRPPFDDPRMRRALTMALDRELLVEAYVYGFGAVADGPVLPNHPWFDEPVPVGHDVAEAERLLDQMGWVWGGEGVRRRNGRELSLTLLTVGSADNALEQMIQAQLRTVGVHVEIRQLELTTFLSIAQSRERDFDALVTGIPGDLSLGHVAALFGGENPGPLAYSGYGSTEFDDAMRRVARAESAVELERAWRDAQRTLSQDLPATWLYHARGVQGVNRRIRGIDLDIRGELAGVANWWIADEEEMQ
jgi:peptide/nickel transport system substrate-binding protein